MEFIGNYNNIGSPIFIQGGSPTQSHSYVAPIIQQQPIQEDLNDRSTDWNTRFNEALANIDPASLTTNDQYSKGGSNRGEHKPKSTTKNALDWTGETIKNTLVNRPIELFTGFADTVMHPIENIAQPLGDYAANHYWELINGTEQPLQAVGRVACDTGDLFITRPVTGQTSKEIANQSLGETMNKFGEHIHEGGLADIYFTTRAIPKVGGLVNKGISKAVTTPIKTIDKVTGKHLENFSKVRQAKNQINADVILDKIDVLKKTDQFKTQLNDVYKTYNVKEAELKSIIKKAEGNRSLNLKDLSPEEKVVYDNLDPILTAIDDLNQQYETGVPANVIEIVTRGIRRSQEDGINETYQGMQNKYQENGFFDLGQYVDKESGQIVKHPKKVVEDVVEKKYESQGTIPTEDQILRRNGITKTFDYDKEKIKLDKKFTDEQKNLDISNPDYGYYKADLEYKNLINELNKADREHFTNKELADYLLEDAINDAPEEFKPELRERFNKDYEDIYNVKYSEKPLSDAGSPENVARPNMINEKLKNARKYTNISNKEKLVNLSDKTKKIFREYLTPDEYTSFLETGATIEEIMEYTKMVAKDVKESYTKPDVAVNLDTLEPVRTDLRNTRFELSPEAQAKIAEIALDGTNPERAKLANQFLTDYLDSEAGLLRRIPHGLAPINKEGVTVNRSLRKVNKENRSLSERLYGNATPEDIANQLLDTDSLMRYVINNVTKNATMSKWLDEYTTTGKPIMGKYATPEDIIYIKRDMLNTGRFDNAIKNPVKELTDNMKPEEYIAIDKYTLQAFRDLFYPNEAKGQIKIPAWLRDTTQLFKEGLIGSGLYLGGNLTAGLHSLITNSNANLINDISNAIKTRGTLIQDLALHRRTGKYSEPAHMATKKGTPVGDTMRKVSKFNQMTGSWPVRKADATIQNMIAEANAHAVLREKGVHFENRNLDWMKQNMSKEEIYKTIQDIQQASLIYGDETLLPRGVLQAAEIGNPFFRWQDQAAKSSLWLMKKHPALYGYLQGAVLGGYAWDRNEARADGMNISNPQSGKIYRYDKTGNSKVTETELVPILTTLKFAQNPGEYFMRADKNASLGAVLGAFDPKDKYGRLKRRSSDIIPITGNKIYSDYQHNVRYNEKGEQVGVGWDEAFISLAKMTPAMQLYNKTLSPIASEAMKMATGDQGYQIYQPYNDQLGPSTQGNVYKPYGMHEIKNRLLTNYEHNPIPGEDYLVDSNQLQKYESSEERSKAKTLKALQERQRKEKIRRDARRQ